MYALIHLVAMWELQNDHYTNLGRTGAVGDGQDWKRWHTDKWGSMCGEQAMPAPKDGAFDVRGVLA